MANSKIIEKKAEYVEQITQKIKDAQSVVIVDYRGLTVLESTELRALTRAENVEMLVIKNSTVERAAEKANIDSSINEMLKGPSAFLFGNEDVVAPARIVHKYFSKVNKGTIKGGIVDNVVNDAETIRQIAELPSRDELISRILGSIKAPLSKLAIALGQIKEQKEAAEN